MHKYRNMHNCKPQACSKKNYIYEYIEKHFDLNKKRKKKKQSVKMQRLDKKAKDEKISERETQKKKKKQEKSWKCGLPCFSFITKTNLTSDRYLNRLID